MCSKECNILNKIGDDFLRNYLVDLWLYWLVNHLKGNMIDI